MAGSLQDLRAKYEIVAPYIDEVQIDVMDGVFVPSESWRTPEDLVAAEWLTLPFELHLMIDKPERTMSRWLATGAERIIVHIESTEQLGAIFELARPLGTEIALGVKVDTPLSRFEKWLPQVKTAQFMGIAKVGYQGQPFDDRVVGRITELKARAPHVTIAVDGGVNGYTIPLLIAAGATRLAVGSAIFTASDPQEAYRALQTIVSQHA